MFLSIAQFRYEWSQEIEATQKVLKHLTDRSLTVDAAPGYRTPGRLAWHIVQTIPELMGHTGLTVSGPHAELPVPVSAREILAAYNTAAIELLDTIQREWTDKTLEMKDSVYGSSWKRGFTLRVLVNHQIHHRGQLTALMRVAGLEVPGIYGPAKQEWAAMGGTPPAI